MNRIRNRLFTQANRKFLMRATAVATATTLVVLPYKESKNKRLSSLVDQISPPYAETEPDSRLANKKIVAERAVADFVKDGMIVGMGTGTTCFHAVEEIGRRVRHGDLTDIKVIPCSVEVKKHCISEGIPVSSLSFASGNLDVMIDGADEIDPTMALIKGGSGSFLREKMMENYSNQVIIVADDTKLVRALGLCHPLPVEVIAWDYERTVRIIESMPSMAGCRGVLRRGNITSPIPDGAYPAITDNGNFIVDFYFYKPITDVSTASAALDGMPGVVEHGLFAGQATTILVASDDEKNPVRVLGHYPKDEKKVEQPWWCDKPHSRPTGRETVDNRQPEVDSAKQVMLTPWMRLQDKYNTVKPRSENDSTITPWLRSQDEGHVRPRGGELVADVDVDSKSGLEIIAYEQKKKE
eukprot:GSChrysophyteH2.ASY1.ANO1.1614.1 assembled CDS